MTQTPITRLNQPDFTPRHVRAGGDVVTLAKQFLAHLGARNYAANTLVNYRRHLEQLAGYAESLHGVTTVHHINRPLLEAFMDALLTGEGNKPRTVMAKMEAVRSFYSWMSQMNIIPAQLNPALNKFDLRFEADPPSAPEPHVLLKLIKTIGTENPLDVRDRAILRLFLDSGLRVSGLASLNLFDVDNPMQPCVRQNGVILYRAKGGKLKETSCGETTLRYINAWLTRRDRFAKAGSDDALFLSQRGTRMNRASLYNMVKSRAKKAGMEHVGVHPHMFRHSRNGDVMRKAGLHAANYMSGHARMSTTSDMYPNRINEIERNAVSKLAALGE